MLFGIDLLGIVQGLAIIVGAIGTIAGFLGKKKVQQKLTNVQDTLDDAEEAVTVTTAAVDQMAAVIKKLGAKEVATEIKAARAEDPDAGEFIKERVTAIGANVL